MYYLPHYYNNKLFCSFLESERPKLNELIEIVTPEYASVWKTIGILLNLNSETINIIEHDCHCKAVGCCNAMFTKWLEVDDNATWKKIKEVLNSPVIRKSNNGCNRL